MKTYERDVKGRVNELLKEISDLNMATFFYKELVLWSQGGKCDKRIGGMAACRGLKNGRKFISYTKDGIKYHRPILTEKGRLLINNITYNEEAWKEAIDDLKTLS